MTALALRHPDRPRLHTRPLKALGHFRKLIADKEDTEQVFRIFLCFPRRQFEGEVAAFMDTEKGQRLLKSEYYLPDLLDDHERLLAMPQGSVGHAYVDFMRREGLSAAGLVAEQDKMFQDQPRYHDLIEWMFNRQRDTHDLLHVLTGYGRDPLGEQCVLAFTYGQNPHFANIFIAYAGGLELKRSVGRGAPVLKAIGQARQNGKLSKKLVHEDIMAMLAEPLEAARERLNIKPPTVYQQAHAHYRARGIDPYDFLKPIAA